MIIRKPNVQLAAGARYDTFADGFWEQRVNRETKTYPSADYHASRVEFEPRDVGDGVTGLAVRMVLVPRAGDDRLPEYIAPEVVLTTVDAATVIGAVQAATQEGRAPITVLATLLVEAVRQQLPFFADAETVAG